MFLTLPYAYQKDRKLESEQLSWVSFNKEPEIFDIQMGITMGEMY